MSHSLPFDYGNLGEAYRFLNDEREDGRLYALESILESPPESGTRAPGIFYDKDGHVVDRPRSSKSVALTKANQYGFLLNAYGEPGNRRVWTTYTSGARQQS